MFIRIEEYFLNEPERLIGLGSALAYIGGVLIVFSQLGNVAKGAIGILGGMGHASAAKTLADIYPSLPTWWIPESIIGTLPAILMIFAGLIIIQFGRRLKRLIESI